MAELPEMFADRTFSQRPDKRALKHPFALDR